MIQFRALGEVSPLVDGERAALGGGRQRRLLAMLLIHRNTVVSVDRLADAVFAGEPTDAAATTLRSYIARVRRVVDGQDTRVRVVTQPPGYCLQVPDELFDVAAFEQAVADAGRCLLRGDPDSAVAAARAALDLWSGDPYAEFDDEMWVQPEAQRLCELRLVAADRCFEAELARGRATDVVTDIERMVHDHPVREGFRSQYMLALYRTGRQADALRAFQDYRSYLIDELGLEPSPALAELETRILAHDPSLATVDAGRSLHGYRLGDRLGIGRDGPLYAARINGSDREFVLRSFRAEIADEPQFVRAFESDAHRLTSLRHPAIVPLHDYWRGPHEAYLAMPRLRGGTLEDRLHHGRLSDRDLVAMVERIGGALVVAASAGVTHGRIDASNVLFDDDGLAYITDFALGSTQQPSAATDVAALATLIDRCASPDFIDLGRTVRNPWTSMADLVAAVLAAAHAVPTRTVNPYKGLEAFDEVDAGNFFGRDEVVDLIVKRLHDEHMGSRLVLVVGGSGTGKSSVVRAGLLPRLRAGAVAGSRNWLITSCTPGAVPFQRLGDALTRLSIDDSVSSDDLDCPGGIAAVAGRVAGDAEVVLVIDQFEELFTMADPETQRRFLGALVEAVSAADSRVRVVATLRADHFDRPLAVPSIGSLVYGATVTIPAMAPSDLEAAIVEPARRVGREVEGPLVAELVGAVIHDSAALPALQFTLYELAERCGTTLTLSAYRELGGLAGAVASRADHLYRSVPENERPLIRRLFRRMVVLHDGEATRRRVAMTDVAGGPDGAVIDALIERWVVARLLTIDRDPGSRVRTVEVAHEALVREWPRLQRWIAEDRDAIGTLARIHEAAAEWVASGRDAGALARGVPLQAALDVAERRPHDLSSVEQEFVEASRVASEHAAAEQANQLARQRRSNRRLRWQLAALGCLLVIALVIGFVAVDQRRTADGARRFATARELAAAAQAELQVDPERSALLALEAIDTTRSQDGNVLVEAVTALHAAVVESRIVRRIEGLGGTVAWSPTGEYLVSEGPEESGIVDLRDPETGLSVRTWKADDLDINDVAFSSDGSMLATSGDDGSLRVWDPDTGELLVEHVEEGAGSVWGPTFSGDGTRFGASWIEEGVIRVLDTSSGDVVGEGDAEGVVSVSLNDDGSRIALGSNDAAYVADVATGEVTATLEAPGAGLIKAVRFSPDGRSIATSGGDGMTRLWDAETGDRTHMFGEPGSFPYASAWSPDSRRLAVGFDDGSTKLWEISDEQARALMTLTAQDTQNGVQGVAFSPDGTRLATGDLGIASIIVWDVSPLGDDEWMNAHTLPHSSAPLTVIAGDQVVAVDVDGGVAAWSMDDGSERAIAATPLDVNRRLAVDPAGAVLATAEVSPGARVEIWDVVTGEQTASFVPPEFEDFVTGLSWSPDGRHLAVSGGDGDSSSIVVVDRTGAVLARFREEPEVYVRRSYFSPDGNVLAIPRRPLRQGVPDLQGLWLWDWAAERMIGRIETQTHAADWHPSGERLVTLSELDSSGAVWDVATLEQLTVFTGTSGFTDVRFSPDGTEFATAANDGDITVWDADDGRPTTTLRGHDSAARSVVFAPDGRRLASVDIDGVMRVWALDIDDLIGIAEEQLTRGLTELECRRYLHRDNC